MFFTLKICHAVAVASAGWVAITFFLTGLLDLWFPTETWPAWAAFLVFLFANIGLLGHVIWAIGLVVAAERD